MKIGIVSHSFYPNKDGVAIHNYYLAKELAKIGEEVHVFTSGDSDMTETIEGVNVHRIWSFRLPIFSSLLICPGLFFGIDRIKPDVIHAHGYGNFFSPIAGLYSLITGRKMVFTLHGYPELHGAKRIFLILYKNILAPMFLIPAKKIISVSQSGKEIIVNESKREVFVLPNGIDLEKFRCKTPYYENELITYVGRLDEDKGVLRIAEEVDPKRKILFAGKDEGMKDRIGKICRERKMDFDFTEVSPDKVPEIYCRSRMILLPSKYEGFPLTMLESLASQRPFLCTDVGEVKRVLKDTMPGSWQYLMISSDIENAIEDVEEHEDEINRDLNQVGKRLEKYSWKKIAIETLEIYRDKLF
ncbi:MAG: glycosyltransferase family 4 protein [Candidatus Micrarchaeota archaeon]|nr:glycosyltransferase family 4 protein [Candidatus Micrarchaeota archaeon]